jgi:hypothetical protein
MSTVDEISLENVLRRCGDFSRYQLIHYIFLSLLNLCSGVTGFYYVFGLAEPLFRCRLPSDIWPADNQYEVANTTHSLLLESFQFLPYKCDDVDGSICYDYVYDRSVYGKTFTEEAQLVCSNDFKKTWLSTAYQIGT